MSDKATLTYGDKSVDLDVIVGSESETGIDIQQLRSKTGWITLDPGYANTGSCESDITFIDGEKGILRYRGIPIEQVCEKGSFLESAYLILFGRVPSKAELDRFEADIERQAHLHEGLKHHFIGLPTNAPPMAILGSMLNTLSCYHPELLEVDLSEDSYYRAATKLISKVRTISAWAYRTAVGRPFVTPNPNLGYAGNFLHMMFSHDYAPYEVTPEIERAMDLFFILHADHEQNCSTSTVRMVGSSRANLFSSVAAGVGALWGPLHGGANAAVIRMLQSIHEDGVSIDKYVSDAKDKTKDVKLMGFGHRVYRNFDPRAKILKVYVDKVLEQLKLEDPLLDIARELEQVALSDPYFAERKLYPNVDFYSGILLRAIGIPVDMFTVMFAIGRMPGWIANWKEMLDHNQRICRPRQIYTGETLRDWPSK